MLSQKLLFTFSAFFSMAPGDKKRPRGLKGVAAQKAAKKAKTETEEDKTQTVILDKEVEEGDELGEVAALYESAKEKLGMLCYPYFECKLCSKFRSLCLFIHWLD
jgi:hypothetical protein